MKPVDISAIVQKILSALPGVAVSGGATSQIHAGSLPRIWEVAPLSLVVRPPRFSASCRHVSGRSSLRCRLLGHPGWDTQ